MTVATGLRHQLPSYSPLSGRALTRAAWQTIRSRKACRENLTTTLAAAMEPESLLITGSGTQALQLAIGIAADRTNGAPVALPAYGCFDLVSAAVGADAPVVFYDIDPEHLTPDLVSLQSALDAGARTVVAAYLYGFPLDWTSLRSLCISSGAVLIEDAAQGIGSGWGSEAMGRFGDLVVLSFGRGKGWTGGGGGALLIRDEALAAAGREAGSALTAPPIAAEVRSAALAWAQWILGRPWIYGLPKMLPGLHLGETVYKAPSELRLPSAHASSVAATQARASRDEAVARQAVADRWTSALASLHEASVVRGCAPIAGGHSGLLRYPIRVPAAHREALLEQLDPLGGASGYPIALPDLPEGAARAASPSGSLLGARALAREIVTLPCHSLVSEADIARATSLLGAHGATGRQIRG